MCGGVFSPDIYDSLETMLKLCSENLNLTPREIRVYEKV